MSKAPFDVVGIVGTGQSLSVGAISLPAISTKQPFANLALDVPVDGSASKGLVPLIEPLRPYVANSYPGNIYGETPHTAMSIQLSTLFLQRTKNDYTTAHSIVGEGGQPLAVIQKGGPTSYPGAMSEAKQIKSLLAAQGKTFGYGAVLLTHGESDALNPDYGAGLVQLQEDYEADLRAITGQTSPIPMLLTQQSSFPPSSTAAALSSIQAWTASVEHPEQIVCVGPKYQYAYSADLVHLTARSEVRMGIKYAEVYDWVLNQKKTWKPLQPKKITRSSDGQSVQVSFDVLFPPIQWDETLTPPHQAVHAAWASGRGFEVSDTLGEVPISQVVLVGPDAARIDLGRALVGAATVGHATLQDAEQYAGGTPVGYRGQLRDSDDWLGFDAESIDCVVQSGVPTLSAAPGAEAALAARGLRDVVTLANGSRATVISAAAGVFTLSAPWDGPGGVQKVSFASDQHNYLVQFSLPIP